MLCPELIINVSPALRQPSNAIHIFRPNKHATRFNASAEAVSIPHVPEAHFVACVKLAVLVNAAYAPPHDSPAILYIRPVAFGSGEQLALAAPSEFIFAVHVKPAMAYHGNNPLDALVIEDFDRAAPRGVGAVKVGGNYAPGIKWTQKAAKAGYALTLHLDSATHTEIDEFSTSGFLGVLKGKEGSPTLVVPDSKAIVDSVTSSACMMLAKSLGWAVEKRNVGPEGAPAVSSSRPKTDDSHTSDQVYGACRVF